MHAHRIILSDRVWTVCSPTHLDREAYCQVVASSEDAYTSLLRSLLRCRTAQRSPIVIIKVVPLAMHAPLGALSCRGADQPRCGVSWRLLYDSGPSRVPGTYASRPQNRIHRSSSAMCHVVTTTTRPSVPIQQDARSQVGISPSAVKPPPLSPARASPPSLPGVHCPALTASIVHRATHAP